MLDLYIDNRFSGTLDVPSSSNVVYYLLYRIISQHIKLKKIEISY